ncbi:MAG: hypothetical protein HYU74_10610 [Dechloromonas sp.]|nr:hypothetical protein [Dechloromonas sp.]
MRLQIAKVLPALALGFVLAEASAAPVYATGSSALNPPPASVANPAAAGPYPNWPGLIVARQLQSGPSGAGGSRWPTAEIRSAPPAGPAKNSALVLSSLGMLGVMSLLRLNRML